ncbi:hypothetical protein PAECIP111893_00409 [Paenibacillus plantiphilus]|uniref:SLH domain-containing protein n=1 Tax=Paenibacillus plantiphilus TaxID=2905650 RepID=A0ABN8FVK2_9BACL|nr:hypothetical protein PAECIP111893_00409 [Paenibacillus plantiphilus]
MSATATNDPELSKQKHLDQIGAKEAWAIAHDQRDITIALVDTGVDIDHPDLKDNLVEGRNLVSPGKPPEDDNGHGTSVAGVLAAEGNNEKGIAGILWRAKIMPIKALDSEGYGDEERLGEAILYAVKNGARIVVLSVGLYRYSPFLKDIALYAESKGVLLVAASGNDGLALGSKAEVKYPAAYPTVLAVSGATSDGKPEPRSNPGSEIDIAAPWNVYTTALGGGYKHEEGTSMAAPQAAAAAALVWSVHPEYKPYQVRAALRQSAKDIGAAGFDNKTGYGLLQLKHALTLELKTDAYEPNDSRDNARRFPLGSKISAELSGGKDRDWYIIEAPFDGVISIQFQGIINAGATLPTVQMTHYAGNKAQSSKETKLGNQTIEWKVKKGRNYFELKFFKQVTQMQLPYLLTSTFNVSPDEYESNDKQYEASTLAPKSQTITGNFHQTGDRDWYVINFTTGGTLKLSASTDSARVDLALAIQPRDDAMQELDENSEGEGEASGAISVSPGAYYIRVHNAMSAQASPTASQYQLQIEFQTRYTDPNEPNDKSYEATGIKPGSEYVGVFSSKNDVDWYQLRLTKRSIVRLTVSGIPTDTRMKAEWFDKRQKSIYSLQSDKNRTVMVKEEILEPGVYYFKMTAAAPFDKQYYTVRINADEMVADFRDIAGHWAESVIVQLKSKGIIGGNGGYRFEPNRRITRAEAVSMLVRAFNPSGGGSAVFNDVSTKHWAHGAITRAVGAEWAAGYPDGKFGPDKSITREEMSVMLARALKLRTVKPVQDPFTDVEQTRWSAGALLAMKQEQLIGGYPNALFKPEQHASRAEFASTLIRALK